MAKLDTETRPILKLTTVEWECPFCHVGNGIPEISVCACEAIRDGGSARRQNLDADAEPAAPLKPKE